MVSTVENNIQICSWVFTFSVKLEKWSFHVTDLPRTWKKCTELKKKHVKGVRNFCFCQLFMQILWHRPYSRVVDLKDVRGKIFLRWDFLHFSPRANSESTYSKNEKKKKQGGTVLRRPLLVSCLHSEFRGFLISSLPSRWNWECYHSTQDNFVST